MKVSLIAHTVITGWEAMREAGWIAYPPSEYLTHPDENEWDSDYLAEFAGRGCYESWGRPNPATATNEGYLAHIIEVEHTSVLEHASATFHVSGVSRNLLMEFRTHRHLSFSARSTRYVDESKADFIEPPIVTRIQLEHHEDPVPLGQLGTDIHAAYVALYERLIAHGLPKKQAREAARSVLPGATATAFVVTGNLHAWRYVLKKRLSPGADAEIRAMAALILAELKEIAPNTFQDM